MYIKTNNNSTYFVKWFYALINDKNNLVLGIGAPVLKDKPGSTEVDSIRDYFNNLITRDRNIINILKQSVNDGK